MKMFEETNVGVRVPPSQIPLNDATGANPFIGTVEAVEKEVQMDSSANAIPMNDGGTHDTHSL